MVRDYSSNGAPGASGVESEDEEESPHTPTSVSSSQGYDSAGSDFVDIEGGFPSGVQQADRGLAEFGIQVGSLSPAAFP